MIKFNILKWLFKRAPMNFYVNSEDGTTTIKSINNTFLGYKFEKQFTDEEINEIWNNVKFQKRVSTILIFLIFIILLYGVIFPNYYFIISQKWYYSVLPLLVIIFIIYQLITFLNTKYFEKKLIKRFGEYTTTIFKPTDEIDTKYYNLFKIELTKAITLLVIIALCFSVGSPFKWVSKCIKNKKYDEAIKITTIGSKIFPIAPEWYSLRAYSKYQVKDFNGAIKDYDKAYKLGPDEYNVMNFDNKIFIKYHIKEYNSALKDFDYEIKNASDDYEKDSFLWDKAQFLYNIKRYKEALDIYNELIINAESDRIFLLKNRLYFERAQVYKKLGQEDLANQDLENADSLSIESSFKNPIPEPTLLYDNI